MIDSRNASTRVSVELPWFQCRPGYWSSGEVASLDFITVGFLHLIHLKLIECGRPLSIDVLIRMARQRGANRRTVKKVIGTLEQRGLIAVSNEGIWCDDLAVEIERLESERQKILERNGNVSRKRSKKALRNQAAVVPEVDADIEGRPEGAPSEDGNSLVEYGPVSAAAERPIASYIDEANMRCDEACQRAYQAALEGPRDYDLCGTGEYTDQDEDIDEEDMDPETRKAWRELAWHGDDEEIHEGCQGAGNDQARG